MDNSRVQMGQVLEALSATAHLDVATAFVDAFGVNALRPAAEEGQVRLLVGYDLQEIPSGADTVSFAMAHEWRDTGEDPLDRATADEYIGPAVDALSLPTFHAKRAARRMHAKLYVSEEFGAVGSSNLTHAGLAGQRELNLLQDEPDAVARLRDWFEGMWEEADRAERSDFKAELAAWLQESRMRRFAPFHPYAKAMFERYRHRFIGQAASSGDVNLAVFQEEGRDTALSILAEHRCCIVADAVGLGKTFIALGVMHRRAQARPRSQRKVLVICPAQLEEVWLRASRDQGVALVTESMETLGNTTGTAAERRLRELAQYALVVVDEAHNFRNERANRFASLMQVLQDGPQDKEVLLLTATPINNGVGDLYSLYRLMTRDRDDFFQATNLRIPSLREFFRMVEKGEASTTELLLETMVCRSRLDIRRRQDAGEVIVINEQEVRFPERRLLALEYHLSTTDTDLSYARIAATVETLTLGAYNVEQYARTPNAQANQSYERLQSLFKILLLKRLESSIASFVTTAERLLHFSDQVVTALREGRCLTNAEYRRLQLQFAQENAEDGEDAAPYFLDLAERDPMEYDVDRLAADVDADRAALEPLIAAARALQGEHDGKIARLKQELLKLLPNRKVIVFTFYSDTARYIEEQLRADAEFQRRIEGARMECVVGGLRSATKTQMVEEFAPRANGRRDNPPARPIQLLISTDVLSEGQNLQDCGYLINYDLHFNPVRMIQRNGRIDRLFSEHPEVTIANFFPEGELEEQLGIVARLQQKIERIQESMPTDSSVIGERVRLFSLEELRRAKQGDARVIDDIDAENPINLFHSLLDRVVSILLQFGIDQIARIPLGCQSNKRATRPGLFLCVTAGPTNDPKHCWWLYYPDPDNPGAPPVQDVHTILPLIESPRPPDEHLSRPDFVPRPIRWDVILDAEARCRRMLVQAHGDQQLGVTWPAGHINRKIQTYLAVLPDPPPEQITRRLGRFGLDRHRQAAEAALKRARETRDPHALLDWLDATLPTLLFEDENPETVHLELVSYLELVPEVEGSRPS